MTELNFNGLPPVEITGREKRARFKQIISIFRRYNVLTNLARQKHPEQVRQAFEELGPTFIKAGQILSSRPDIVSPAYINELKKLQDHVQTDNFLTVRQTIETATGKPIAAMYASFDETPFASASMGQTHHARLKSGQDVVVKVQHPGIEKEVALDISLFEEALPLLKLIPEARVVNLQNLVTELKNSMFTEMNTKNEMTNGERFYNLNNGDDLITVPRVYPGLCAEKVLVNEFMPGKSIKHLLDRVEHANQVADHELDPARHKIAKTIVTNFMKQVFVDGFFHADLHPGNILVHELDPGEDGYLTAQTGHGTYQVGDDVPLQTDNQLPDYRLVYLDFGMMGTISQGLRNNLANVIVAVASQDTRAIGRNLLAISTRTGPVNEEEFYSELGPFLEPYYNSGLGEIDFQNLIFSIVRVCRDNNIQLNSDITMLIRAFGVIEGIVQVLDPDLSMIEVAQPFAKRYMNEQFNPKQVLSQTALAWYKSAENAPKVVTKLSNVLSLLENGGTRLNVNFPHRVELLRSAESMVNRLVTALILAALIIGSSLLVQSHPENAFITDIGMAGYLISFLIIAGMLISGIIRWIKTRHDR